MCLTWAAHPSDRVSIQSLSSSALVPRSRLLVPDGALGLALSAPLGTLWPSFGTIQSLILRTEPSGQKNQIGVQTEQRRRGQGANSRWLPVAGETGSHDQSRKLLSSKSKSEIIGSTLKPLSGVTFKLGRGRRVHSSPLPPRMDAKAEWKLRMAALRRICGLPVRLRAEQGKKEEEDRAGGVESSGPSIEPQNTDGGCDATLWTPDVGKASGEFPLLLLLLLFFSSSFFSSSRLGSDWCPRCCSAASSFTTHPSLGLH